MKKILQKSIASVAALLLAVPVLPVSAVYESQDEIAFALRGIETEGCGYIVKDNTVYVAPSAAAAGTSVHIGMFIEADYADLSYLYARLETDYEGITFNAESYQNPTTYFSEESLPYVTEDGVEFSTRFKPYCFGKINSSGVYVSNSFGVTNKFDDDLCGMNLTWMYGYGDKGVYSGTFFGSRSDEYSFIELDVDIAAGTEAGTYRISFASNTDDGSMGETYLTSDDSVIGDDGKVTEPIYNDFIPNLKDLEIIVTPTDYITPEYPTAYRWMDDTTPLAAEDFFSEDAIMYVGSEKGFTAEKLDLDLISSPVFGSTIQYLKDPDQFICGNMFEMYYDGEGFSTFEYVESLLFCDVKSGLRGDANNDQKVNANDAASILVYAAERGAGGNPYMHTTSYFCADVNEGSKTCGNGDGTALDAKDAGAILQYATIAGSGETPNWNEILR